MDFHAQELAKACRVCGKRVHKAKGRERKYLATSYQKQILQVFGIDVSGDRAAIHPLYFCQPCRAFIATQDGKDVVPVDRVFTWSEHTDTECTVSSKTYLSFRIFTV